MGPHQASRVRLGQAGASTANDRELLTRDPWTGRVTARTRWDGTWTPGATPAPPPSSVDLYAHDGQGRLVGLVEGSSGRSWVGGYEVSDVLAWDAVLGPRGAVLSSSMRHGSWREDVLGGVAREEYRPLGCRGPVATP